MTDIKNVFSCYFVVCDCLFSRLESWSQDISVFRAFVLDFEPLSHGLGLVLDMQLVNLIQVLFEHISSNCAVSYSSAIIGLNRCLSVSSCV